MFAYRTVHGCPRCAWPIEKNNFESSTKSVHDNSRVDTNHCESGERRAASSFTRQAHSRFFSATRRLRVSCSLDLPFDLSAFTLPLSGHLVHAHELLFVGRLRLVGSCWFQSYCLSRHPPSPFDQVHTDRKWERIRAEETRVRRG